MDVSMLALYNKHCESMGFNETPMTLQTPQASFKKTFIEWTYILIPDKKFW